MDESRHGCRSCHNGIPLFRLGVGIVVAIAHSHHLQTHGNGHGLVTHLSHSCCPTLLLFVPLEASNAIIKRPDGMNESLALHNAVDPRTYRPIWFSIVDLTDEGLYTVCTWD